MVKVTRQTQKNKIVEEGGGQGVGRPKGMREKLAGL